MAAQLVMWCMTLTGARGNGGQELNRQRWTIAFGEALERSDFRSGMGREARRGCHGRLRRSTLVCGS
jgi:hypothetical protein